MTLGDAIERLTSRRKMLSVTGFSRAKPAGFAGCEASREGLETFSGFPSRHDDEEDLVALGKLLDTVVAARRAAEEIFCTCNSARHFDAVARSVLDVLEVPSASPHPFAPTCPFHREG